MNSPPIGEEKKGNGHVAANPKSILLPSGLNHTQKNALQPEVTSCSVLRVGKK